MTISISGGELIVGNHSKKPRATPVFPEYGAKWIINEMDRFETRTTDPLVIDPNDKVELISLLKEWGEGTFDLQAESAIDPDSLKAQKAGVISIGTRTCGTGNTIPDYERILPVGLNGLIKQMREKLNDLQIHGPADIDRFDFYKAGIISCEAVIRFANRYSKLAKEMAEKETDPVRKNELLSISSVCANVPANEPKNFWEAVQFVWFFQLCVQLEDNGTRGELCAI